MGVSGRVANPYPNPNTHLGRLDLARKHAPVWEEGMPRIEPALEQAGRSAAELQRRDGPARAVMAEQQQRVAALIPDPHP